MIYASDNQGAMAEVSQTRLADETPGLSALIENKEIVIFFAEDSHGLIPGVKLFSIMNAVVGVSYG